MNDIPLTGQMTISRVAPLVFLLCLSSVARPQDARRACVSADATLEGARWPHPETSPPRAEVDALERRMKSAPESSIPAVLLQLGRMKTRFVVDSVYAAARPDEYFYNEIAGSWMYSGWHFSELLRRFPRHPFADDAFYEKTFLPAGGECEGYVPCRVSVLWMRIEPFLRAYPASPLADSAVARALLAFGAVTRDMDLVRGSADIDVPEIRRLVDGLEAVAQTLQMRHRVMLLSRVAELREQMGDLRAARSTYRLAADLQAGSVSDCAARHVRRLEARLARP